MNTHKKAKEERETHQVDRHFPIKNEPEQKFVNRRVTKDNEYNKNYHHIIVWRCYKTNHLHTTSNCEQPDRKEWVLLFHVVFENMTPKNRRTQYIALQPIKRKKNHSHSKTDTLQQICIPPWYGKRNQHQQTVYIFTCKNITIQWTQQSTKKTCNIRKKRNMFQSVAARYFITNIDDNDINAENRKCKRNFSQDLWRQNVFHVIEPRHADTHMHVI